MKLKTNMFRINPDKAGSAASIVTTECQILVLFHHLQQFEPLISCLSTVNHQKSVALNKFHL